VEERLAAFAVSIPSGSQLAETCTEVIDEWHRLAPPFDWPSVPELFAVRADPWEAGVAGLCLVNCFQWHLEDECRAAYADAERLAALKRVIDDSNRRRVGRIDALDQAFARELDGSGSSRGCDLVALVTPGALVDRISILALKRYHARSDDAVAAALVDELGDACDGFDRLIDDLGSGRQRLRLYRTVKLYGAGP
jgi:hypothetical protein